MILFTCFSWSRFHETIYCAGEGIIFGSESFHGFGVLLTFLYLHSLPHAPLESRTQRWHLTYHSQFQAFKVWKEHPEYQKDWLVFKKINKLNYFQIKIIIFLHVSFIVYGGSLFTMLPSSLLWPWKKKDFLLHIDMPPEAEALQRAIALCYFLD